MHIIKLRMSYNVVLVCVLLLCWRLAAAVCWRLSSSYGRGSQVVCEFVLLVLLLYCLNMVCDLHMLFSIICNGEEYNHKPAKPLIAYNISELDTYCTNFLKLHLESVNTLLREFPFGHDMLYPYFTKLQHEYAPYRAQLEYMIGIVADKAAFQQWDQIKDMETQLMEAMQKLADLTHPQDRLEVEAIFDLLFVDSTINHFIHVANICIDASMRDINISNELSRLSISIWAKNCQLPVSISHWHAMGATRNVAIISAKGTMLNELLSQLPIDMRIFVFRNK